MNEALNSRNRPTRNPTHCSHLGRMCAERASDEVVNTNIAAIRIAKKMRIVWPKIGNCRALTGSISVSLNWTTVARTEIAAAPTKNRATNTIPLMSCRLDCRALSRTVDAAAQSRSATMNHRKAMPANGSR